MRDVYIIGTGMTRFAKHLNRTEKMLVATAVERTLKDAGISNTDIQSAVTAYIDDVRARRFPADEHCFS